MIPDTPERKPEQTQSTRGYADYRKRATELTGKDRLIVDILLDIRHAVNSLDKTLKQLPHNKE